LSDLGAEVVQGDFLDLPSLEAAMKGVKRVYFCHPLKEKLLEGTMNVAIAARREGIEGLVNMSQLPSREIAAPLECYGHHMQTMSLY